LPRRLASALRLAVLSKVNLPNRSSTEMEQSCYKCGQLVEEGIPFCPHCGAPQIRVVIAQAAPALAVAADTPITTESPNQSAEQAVPVVAVPMHWSGAMKPCALAALVGVVLIFLGLYPIVAMLSAGFLAVIFFRQGNPGFSIRTATAARVGALSGLLWFAIASIVGTLLTMVLHKGPEIRSKALEMLQQMASQTTDPQAIAMFDRFKSPEGLEFLMIASLLLAFLASLILGSLGGVLAGFMLRRRDRR
jgi:hypothetical protein